MSHHGRQIDPFDKDSSSFFCETKRIRDRRHKNFIRSIMDEQRRDNIIENVFIESSAANPYHEKVEESTALCAELKEQKRQRFLEEKRRQLLRENNEELKLLERQLRKAYISQTLAAQTADQEAIRNREKVFQMRENELMEQAILKHKEYEMWKEQEEHKRKSAFKKDLEEQMAYTCAKRKRHYEEFLREKKAIDDIIHAIQQEEFDAAQAKLEKKAQVFSEMKEFLRDRAEWEEKQKQRTDDEDRRIAEFLRKREEEIAASKEEKRRNMLEKELLSAKIGEAVLCVEKEKAKRADLLEDLLVQELRAKEDSKYREELEKHVRERMQVRHELDHHMAIIRQQKEVEKDEERRYREELLQQMAERDKLEQLSDEKRRRKVLEHRKALQECLEQKKRTKAKEMTALLKKRQELINEEERKTQLVEEERIRILREHVPHVLQFLPPGVLRESDREVLNLGRL